jgi:molecular chaperone DnaK
MERVNIDFGIDLGTTNSVISVASGAGIETVKNGLSEITPSLVWIDKKGIKKVGLPCVDKFKHPLSAIDVQAEFKRVMGQRVQRQFKTAGRSMTPEELSSEVLMELRRTAAVRFGEEPMAAVITVPAMFELPQNEATANAAKLAGFTHSQLLQEPVAAAVAYGFQSDAEREFWLVYDYGGGTFDASIVAIRDGQLTVVRHAGDNYLGGADFDLAIVDRLLVPSLQKQYELSGLNRDAKASDMDRGRLLVLKLHAERIKKELSTGESASYTEEGIFEDDSGESVDLDVEITRAQYEQLIATNVDRSVGIVRNLIAESGLKASDIKRFLLVGGSTFTPLIRRKVAEFGIPLGMEIDPMTVVSRGAAVFASSQRLPSSRKPVVAAGVRAATVQLEYESLVRELTPSIGGKVEFEGKAPAAGSRVRIRRDDSGWDSGEVALDAQGMFFVQVPIRERDQTSFKVEALLPDGTSVPCVPGSFAIRYGLSVATATLPQGCGVGLANGKTDILHRSGSSLPTTVVTTKNKFTRGLKQGSSDRLVIPIVAGNEDQTDLNRIGTSIGILGTDVTRDIPVGTDVEVSISIDSSGVPRTTVFVPLLDETFEPKEPWRLEHENYDEAKARLDRLEGRLGALQEEAGEAGLPNTRDQAAGLSRSAEMKEARQKVQSLKGGGADTQVAAGQARNILVSLAKQVSELERQVALPAAIKEFNEACDQVRRLVSTQRNDEAKQVVEELIRLGNAAVQANDCDGVTHTTEQLKFVSVTLLRKDPAFLAGMLHRLSQQEHEFTDRAAARKLLAEGAAAAQRRDADAMDSVMRQLISLLPKDVAQQVQGGGSDII